MPPVNVLTTIKNYFEYPSLKDFSADWKLLDDTSKAELRSGIESGSYTY